MASKKTTSPGMRAADNIRILSAAMVEQANSGHPGGPMGGADFVHVLFSEFMNYDPSDMKWELRDRFFLDPGHMSAMLYSVQALLGNYKMNDLKKFRQWKSVTPGHPEIDVKRGIENTSGPLGLGHAFGIGAAIAEQFLVARFGKRVAHQTYIYISDGGVQEEISQGGGRIAGHLGLGGIVMFYDANDIQLSTEVDVVTGEDTAKKYESWGWHVTTIDGNDHDQIRQAIKEGKAEKDRPTLIIGKTKMGKGVRSDSNELYEGEVELHGKPLGKSSASYQLTIEGLGGDPKKPFQIFPDVAKLYEKSLASKKRKAAKRKASFKAWMTKDKKKGKMFRDFFAKKAPQIDWASIEQKSNPATRDASGAVLAHLAETVPNMIVASADLANSDKTDNFLRKTKPFKRGDFSGAFLQAGVSELTMAALSIGMSLHGGVIPACATFFAFSDYMKPAIRVAALMEVNVIFIWTHDAFRVGEDGPTHQPIEQEAQIRLLEHLKNHSGENSFVALRPGDAAETTIAWKLCMEDFHRPSGLILSRQGVKDIPAMGRGNRFKQAEQTAKGAYIVHDCKGTPKVVLVGNGSEVATLLEGAALLEKDKIKVRVVSAPSEGLFRNQTAKYQESVLPAKVAKYGLTAGLPVNLLGLVGTDGVVHGLEHFGYSAPYTVLDEKFGFTGENVYQDVKKMLKK